jgi:hypothetical protein
VIHIAICPLLHGAIAAVDDDGRLVLCEDLPQIREPGGVAWIDIKKLTTQIVIARDNRRAQAPLPARISINQCNVRNEPDSAFLKGVVLGSILAAIQQLNLPAALIQAAKWKDSMGFGPEPTWSMHKSAMLDLARHHFPDAKLDRDATFHAEALLLAEYCRQAAMVPAKPSNVVPIRATA